MKNKILSILCIFILVSFIFINNNTFATSNSFYLSINGTIVELPDFYNNINTSNGFIITSSDLNEFRIMEFLDTPYDNRVFSEVLYSFETFRYYTSEAKILGSWKIYTYTLDGSYTVEYTSNDHWDWSYHWPVVYSSYNIYDVDGQLFFHQAPLSLTAIQVLEQNSPMKIFQTMTHGMIPYLIVFLVGLVAFWKAWQLLLKELRKA